MKKYVMELSMTCLLLVSFYFLSREAAVVSREIRQENKVILIDPGHGGMDPGMIGIGNLEEKGINLSIAMQIRDDLEKKGFRVVMTRTGDEGLYEEDCANKKAQDMQRRIALIREKSPVLSVSIHQNSYQDSSVKGPQVFYYEGSAEGRELAESIQKKLNEELDVQRPRMAKGNTSYYLLKRSPGILAIVECGFLTNPEEAAKLKTESYQKKAAQAVSEGICEYIEKISSYLGWGF